MRSPNAGEVLSALVFFTPLAATYALIVALPVIIFSEVKQLGDWKLFAAAGLILGVLVTGKLTGMPHRGADLGVMATMIGSASVGATTYWLIAWKYLPLKPKMVAAQ